MLYRFKGAGCRRNLNLVCAPFNCKSEEGGTFDISVTGFWNSLPNTLRKVRISKTTFRKAAHVYFLPTVGTKKWITLTKWYWSWSGYYIVLIAMLKLLYWFFYCVVLTIKMLHKSYLAVQSIFPFLFISDLYIYSVCSVSVHTSIYHYPYGCSEDRGLQVT